MGKYCAANDVVRCDQCDYIAVSTEVAKQHNFQHKFSAQIFSAKFQPKISARIFSAASAQTKILNVQISTVTI